jgi:peptide deformylase
MAILSIHKYPHPVLKQEAQPVTEIDDTILQLIDDMAETMYQAPGVGLAANQVGALHRVIVCDISPREEGPNLVTLINPEIVASEGEMVYKEGCLSVEDFTSEVRRKACVTVVGLDREGKQLEIKGENLLAIVLQHEIDHLNGTLFIDRLSRLKRSLYLRQIRKQQKK